jgi:GT2 family glycosyltransferase
MIPTFNCADYLRETLGGVLAQDPGTDLMQIEIVDDHSTKDDPESVVKELGGSRVEFFRQPQNTGLSRNFNTCLERARGHFVHLLHGDDGVLPGFYENMQRALSRHPKAGAAFCRHHHIDETGRRFEMSRLEQSSEGIIPNWLSRIALGQRVQTPCMTVRREVYEALGGFDGRLSYGEDWEMWVRIAASYPVVYVPEPLAQYRVHSVSSTARGVITGENGRDYRKAIEIVAGYLPSDISKAAARLARRDYADGCFRRAGRALKAGNEVVMTSYIRDGLRTQLHLKNLAKATYLWLKFKGKAAKRRAKRSPKN